MKTETISFYSGEEKLEAYVARPEGRGPFPGVVVIHEIFGLNDNIKDVARRLADEGYAAFAVDLFAGRNRAVCILRFFTELTFKSLDNSGIRDLTSALSHFADMPYVAEGQLGAIGFCMGGGFAIAWACTDNRLKVIAPFYGTNPRPLSAVARSCPVVGSYPGADYTANFGRKLAGELREHKVPHDIKIYPGAKHSFFNDQGRTSDPAAASDAWGRTLDFFREYLI